MSPPNHHKTSIRIDHFHHDDQQQQHSRRSVGNGEKRRQSFYIDHQRRHSVNNNKDHLRSNMVAGQYRPSIRVEHHINKKHHLLLHPSLRVEHHRNNSSRSIIHSSSLRADHRRSSDRHHLDQKHHSSLRMDHHRSSDRHHSDQHHHSSLRMDHHRSSDRHHLDQKHHSSLGSEHNHQNHHRRQSSSDQHSTRLHADHSDQDYRALSTRAEHHPSKSRTDHRSMRLHADHRNQRTSTRLHIDHHKSIGHTEQHHPSTGRHIDKQHKSIYIDHRRTTTIKHITKIHPRSHMPSCRVPNNKSIHSPKIHKSDHTTKTTIKTSHDDMGIVYKNHLIGIIHKDSHSPRMTNFLLSDINSIHSNSFTKINSNATMLDRHSTPKGGFHHKKFASHSKLIEVLKLKISQHNKSIKKQKTIHGATEEPQEEILDEVLKICNAFQGDNNEELPGDFEDLVKMIPMDSNTKIENGQLKTVHTVKHTSTTTNPSGHNNVEADSKHPTTKSTCLQITFWLFYLLVVGSLICGVILLVKDQKDIKTYLKVSKPKEENHSSKQSSINVSMLCLLVAGIVPLIVHCFHSKLIHIIMFVVLAVVYVGLRFVLPHYAHMHYNWVIVGNVVMGIVYFGISYKEKKAQPGNSNTNFLKLLVAS